MNIWSCPTRLFLSTRSSDRDPHECHERSARSELSKNLKLSSRVPRNKNIYSGTTSKININSIIPRTWYNGCQKQQINSFLHSDPSLSQNRVTNFLILYSLNKSENVQIPVAFHLFRLFFPIAFHHPILTIYQFPEICSLPKSFVLNSKYSK